MYVPEHFSFEDDGEILDFAKQHSFAILVSMAGKIPYATHLPLIMDDSAQGICLEGHIASANPHGDLLSTGQHMAIFHGPHAYISPTWYHGPGVPTWNYVAVHMSGTVHLIHDPTELSGIVERLAAIYESSNPNPWSRQYTPTMLRAITGFRLQVQQISAKRKLSQDRSAHDQRNVIAALANPFGRDPDTLELETRQQMLTTLRK